MSDRKRLAIAPLDRLVERKSDGGSCGGESSSEEWAIGLLRNAAPFEIPPGLKRRMQMELDRGRPRRASTRLLRPALVAAILLGGGAIASATLTHWPTRMIHGYEHLVQRRSPQLSAKERTMLPSIAPTAPVSPSALAPVPPAVTTKPRARVAGGPLAGVRSKPAAVPWNGEDPSLLAEAMRALRLDHDPVRARALSGSYLARHPGGALVDEALAISIEAALDHGDPDAPGLGAQYLKTHPTGQFRGLAERALSSGRRP